MSLPYKWEKHKGLCGKHFSREFHQVLQARGKASTPAQSLVFGRESQAGEIQVLRKIIQFRAVRFKGQRNPPVLTFEHCQLLLQVFFITELWVTEKLLKQKKKSSRLKMERRKHPRGHLQGQH